MSKFFNPKLFVLGAFGYKDNQLDGQTIKTRSIYNLLIGRFHGKVAKIDTLDVKEAPWKMVNIVYHLLTCNTLVIMPSYNNFTYLFPVCYILSLIFRYDIILICIGGRQTEYFSGQEKFSPHKLQLYCSKRIKVFMPEMEIENSNLITKFHFKNTVVLPNFRKFENRSFTPIFHDELKMVFMGRVIIEKGFPVIFDALDKLEKKGLKVNMVFYGQIGDKDKNLFLTLIRKYRHIASYEGWLNPEDIQRTLSQFDLMLLPTQHFTEGFPGSILDAYISGIPVIVTEWKYSREFVTDGKTGFIIPYSGESEDLAKSIHILCKNRDKLLQMKRFAYEERKKYSEDVAWNILKKYIGLCSDF